MSMLEDRKIFKIIPWEDDLKLKLQMIIDIRNCNYFSSQRKFSDSDIKKILSLSP